MRFKVPQFIDVEDKIFGPFTFKQFVYMAGGAGLSYVLYKILPIYTAIILILPIVGLSAALTFLKINGKPFIDILQAFLNYILKTKLYVWKKEFKKDETKKVEVEVAEEPKHEHRLTESRLKDLSWSLDVLDMKKK